jgi:hypothetical protein
MDCLLSHSTGKTTRVKNQLWANCCRPIREDKVWGLPNGNAVFWVDFFVPARRRSAAIRKVVPQKH